MLSPPSPLPPPLHRHTYTPLPPAHRIRSVQTEEELEKLWKEAENKNLESNDLALLCELYTLRKGELNSEGDSTVNSTSS